MKQAVAVKLRPVLNLLTLFVDTFLRAKKF